MLVKINGKLFSDVLKALGAIVKELRVKVDTDGWSICATDDTNVALIDIKIPYSAFKEYLLGEPFEFALPVSDMMRIRSVIKNEKTIEISITEGDTMLFVKFGNTTFKRKLTPLDLVRKSANHVSTGYEKLKPFETNIKNLNEILKKAKLLPNCERALFILDKKSGFTCKLIDKSDSDYIPTIDLEFPSATVETNQTSLYSIYYLASIIEGIESDLVRFIFETDRMLDISFELDEDVKVTYLLAPRIEGEIKTRYL